MCGDARQEMCRASMLVPGPLQTMQRAESWSTILPLQAFWPSHLGRRDNLHVVQSAARLLDHGGPLPLVKDGDLISTVHHLILARGSDTVRVTKIKAMPLHIEADTAADLGRRHQSEVVMYVRRAFA